MGLIGSLITGFIAGSLASWIMPGGGRHWVVDITLGILGGLVGGWIFDLLGIQTGGGWWINLIIAIIGACILIFIGRLFTKKK
ncbi:MAG: GlsB/YeaQ/YmgE family stress response membrane protein [Bacteroidales bacterium]|uniref:GlsB/YeaQ/YmgE family stress response membrane protein n=1 Tax=Porphyromonas sp. TaxID=1924944 RepID=UPI002972EB5C|nr:GlsB/YeaQ/YmgE family stress response membrane protein [Porphyromonas sp.]MDD7437354.1 GlsB/YeaQ/YmgE family stress response membrane protein [Bacteroidales bacterium]MDY3066631.1 GlsB/YeaQ/YmgE family stress response membrane protein [Porphyromonas sp.]